MNKLQISRSPIKRNIVVFLIITASILQNSILFGQRKLITDSDTPLVKGFYRDFYEFKYNKPSVPFDNKIDTLKEFYGAILIPNGSQEYFGVKLKKDQIKLLKGIFGFCDGKNVYKACDFKLFHPYVKFRKIDFIGRYCLYSEIVVKNKAIIYTPFEGSIFVPVKNGLTDFVLDLNTGHLSVLRKKFVEEIIVQDPELAVKYKFDLNEDKKYKDYIIEYSLKHKNEIKTNSNELLTDEIITRLYKDSVDSTYEKYYNRIKELLPKVRKVKNIEFWESKYGNGNYRFIGLCGYHNLTQNPTYKYKIGVWRYFYKNGNLKKEILYDLVENKIYEKEYKNE